MKKSSPLSSPSRVSLSGLCVSTKTLIIWFLTSSSVLAFAQTSEESTGPCIANAGPDRIICTNMYGVDTTQIGTVPAATGGTPPYTYSWEANYSITIGTTTFTSTASDYLNDTTIATPLIIAWENKPVTFVLTVKDNAGTICKDTTIIKFSRFVVKPSYYSIWTPPNNDIFLDQGINVTSNFPPFQYLWKPSQGLADSTSLSFWIHTDSSIAYYVTLTDSAGCSYEASPFYYIVVLPLGTNEAAVKNFKITTFPNPSKDIININVDCENTDNLVFEFFDSTGQIVKKEETNSKTLQLKTDIFSKGIIFYRVTEHGALIGQGKLIIE